MSKKQAPAQTFLRANSSHVFVFLVFKSAMTDTSTVIKLNWAMLVA